MGLEDCACFFLKYTSASRTLRSMSGNSSIKVYLGTFGEDGTEIVEDYLLRDLDYKLHENGVAVVKLSRCIDVHIQPHRSEVHTWMLLQEAPIFARPQYLFIF